MLRPSEKFFGFSLLSVYGSKSRDRRPTLPLRDSLQRGTEKTFFDEVYYGSRGTLKSGSRNGETGVKVYLLLVSVTRPFDILKIIVHTSPIHKV